MAQFKLSCLFLARMYAHRVAVEKLVALIVIVVDSTSVQDKFPHLDRTNRSVEFFHSTRIQLEIRVSYLYFFVSP